MLDKGRIMKQEKTQRYIHLLYITVIFSITILLAGCPYYFDDYNDPEYEQGFNDGFAQDDYYWAGFYDSYDTRDGGEIYYQGDQIPQVASPAYDAGYYDGLWYAYNDGYFVEYDYAFTIGFSEGYDCGYQVDWATFLAVDQHVEWLDGGFTDGYNDGFSEGRVFGAYDYEYQIPYDWLDAMMDYRSGTDLEMGGVATGNYGPVILYEWGTDPKTLMKSNRTNVKSNRSIRHQTSTNSITKFSEPNISYRPLIPDAESKYQVIPTTSTRYSSRPLTLKTSWLERINEYLSTSGQ